MSRVALLGFVLLLLGILPAGAEEWKPQPKGFLRSDARRATILAHPGDSPFPEVRLFSAQAGDVIFAFQGQGIRFSTFSYDSRSRHFLIHGDMEGRIGFWQQGSSEPSELIPAHDGPVRSLAVSPYGGMAVSGGMDGRALVIHTTARQVLHELRGHEGPVTSVAWQLPRRVITGCLDGWLRVYDPVGGGFLHRLHAAGPVTKVAADFGPRQLSPREGRHAASVTDEGIVQLWDMLAFQETGRLQSQDGRITGVAFMRRFHGNVHNTNEVMVEPVKLVTWTDRGVVENWSIPSGTSLGILYRHHRPISDLVFRSDALEFMVVDDLGAATLVNSPRGTTTTRFSFGPDRVGMLDFTPDDPEPDDLASP